MTENKNEQVKDWLLRYGYLLGRRFSNKERTQFLKAAQREFAQMGYATDVTSSSFVFAGARRQFYNFYAGDLKQADVIVATYYDTPAKTFGAYRESAFESIVFRKSLLVNVAPSLLIFALALIVSYAWLLPMLNRYGWSSVWVFPFLAVVFLSLFLINRYRSGVPRRLNLVRNSSSLISMLVLARELQARERVAFAFVDGGTSSGYGLGMAQDYFKEKAGRGKFIVLDSLGNGEALLCFSNRKLDGIENVHLLPQKWARMGEVLLTTGQLKEGEVVLKKKSELDETALETYAEVIEKIIQKI
jgi:hypothetical protein